MIRKTIHHSRHDAFTLKVTHGLATVHPPASSPDYIHSPLQFDEPTAAKMLATFGRMRAALVRLTGETPFDFDADGCQCGVNGTGYDDDGKPCEHIEAARSLAETADIITN